MTNKTHLEKSNIDPRALGIVEALQSKQYTTYLVGGCVRDLLIGLVPKDFDIGTIATPQQIKKSVPNSYIIGKRFRLVLAKRGDDLFEIATFRKQVPEAEKNEDFPKEDNSFGTPQQDALRRDFTVNGLFYDPFKEELIDYCDGIKDIESRTIRMIGDPDKRLVEDSIRILRAIRLSHRTGFSLDPNLRAAIQRNVDSLKDSALPRRREEFLKILKLFDPTPAFLELYDLGVLKVIAPLLNEAFEDSKVRPQILRQLRNFQEWYVDMENPVELFSGLLYPYVRRLIWTDPYEAVTNKKIEAQTELTKIMKFELGMFNQEQEDFTKAFKLQQQLQNTEEFRRKGLKRQMAILRNSGFRLALHFAKLDGVMHDADWFFWYQKYESNWAETIPETPKKGQRRRRKKSRPRKKK
jgi:poly(A) polymerase